MVCAKRQAEACLRWMPNFARSFFNLLQGEYHIQRLLGLSITEQGSILFIQRVITGYMPLLMAQPCQWLADSSEHQPVG